MIYLWWLIGCKPYIDKVQYVDRVHCQEFAFANLGFILDVLVKNKGE